MKLYSTEHTDDIFSYEIIESQIINLVISSDQSPDHVISPRVLLIRPNNIVWEYFHSREISREDDLDPEFRKVLARKLARFNATIVPVKRIDHKQEIRTIFNKWLSQAMIDSVYNGTLNAVFHELDLKDNIKSNNLRIEANYVRDLILAIQNPMIVFSHKDLTHANILRSLDYDNVDNDNGMKTIKNEHIRFIDFDLSGYFYLGCDIGRYFADCTHNEFHGDDLIPDSIMLEFIEYYLEECREIFGPLFGTSDKNNSSKASTVNCETILIEAKIFVLFSYWMDIIFTIWMAEKYSRSNQIEKMKQFVVCETIC